MENERDRLTIYTADIRTTRIVIWVLLAVLVVFSVSFGLKAYRDTADLEEPFYNMLFAALFAFPFIAIGILVVACSLRPFVFSAKGITRWPSMRLSWDKIESYEVKSIMDRRSGYRLLLYTTTDAFPVDLMFAGFLLSEKDCPRVVDYLESMGVARRSTVSSSRAATDTSSVISERPEDRVSLSTSARDGSRILLHLGKEGRHYRRVAVGFVLSAAVGVPTCWSSAEKLIAAGVPESLLFVMVLLLLGGSIPLLILLAWVPQQAFLTESGVLRWPWVSLGWNQIEYYELGAGPSAPISKTPWPRLRVYSKRSGFPRMVYYWTGRMPKADRLRIERIMAEKGIPAYPHPGPF
jgi:hypothetical protein